MHGKGFSLVADIGGTNARFALVEDGDKQVQEIRNLACANYPTLVDAIQGYLSQLEGVAVQRAAISVASPVTGDRLAMTNHSWSFSVQETREALGLGYLKVLNDYTALALALPYFGEDQCLKIGSGEALNGYPKAVLGPGTGLGVSGVIPVDGSWLPLESEGGHASYGPASQREFEVIQVIRKRLNHVSAESLVSGPGLSLLYEVITGLDLGEARRLKPGEVSDLAIKGQCNLASEAMALFCGILGNVAGNLALTLGARGGVYIGGGIVRKVIGLFIASSFRERFEQHGRLTNYLREIPTYVIDTDYPALDGAVVSLADEYRGVGVTSQSSG